MLSFIALPCLDTASGLNYKQEYSYMENKRRFLTTTLFLWLFGLLCNRDTYNVVTIA